jgi:ribosomal protein S20
VQDVASFLTATAIKTASIAATPAISRTGFIKKIKREVRKLMTKEQFEREKNYQVMLFIIKKMARKGLITEQEYKKIGSMMLEKYNPLLGSLCGI